MAIERNRHYYQEDRRSIRQMLDATYACLEVCLIHVYYKLSFQRVCAVLCEEISSLHDALEELAKRFERELPISSEEPMDVNWKEESEKLQEYSQSIRKHAHYDETNRLFKPVEVEFVVVDELSPGNPDATIKEVDMRDFQFVYPRMLSDNLNRAASLCDRIDNSLHPLEDPSVFTDYSERELKAYEISAQWINNDLRKIQNKMAKEMVTAKAKKYYVDQRNAALWALHEIAPNALSDDMNTIYHEGLGRYMWGTGHGEEGLPPQEVLCLVQTVLFFNNKTDLELTFLNREVSEEEQQQPSTKAEELRARIRQNTLDNVIFLTNCCSEYFGDNYDEAWIRTFWIDAIDDPKVGDIVCQRLSTKTKKNKTICHTLGELMTKGVINATQSELVDVLLIQKPGKQTLKDYIRHGFGEDDVLHTWIQEYKPKENPTQPNDQVGNDEG